MQVHIQNDGPVTISIESPAPKPAQQKQVSVSARQTLVHLFFFFSFCIFFFLPFQDKNRVSPVLESLIVAFYGNLEMVYCGLLPLSRAYCNLVPGAVNFRSLAMVICFLTLYEKNEKSLLQKHLRALSFVSEKPK